jgi:hypothetical protein
MKIASDPFLIVEDVPNAAGLLRQTPAGRDEIRADLNQTCQTLNEHKPG